jgi:hypothetical protein
MSLVEDAYQQAIAAMTPAEKLARMAELNAWGRWNIERRIVEAEGPLPPEILKWRVALWLYGQQPVVRQLIEEQLADVSR